MPESFSQTQLTKIEAALAKNPGVKQVTVDGVTVTFDDLMAQRDMLRREIASAAGNRSPFVRVNLGGFE